MRKIDILKPAVPKSVLLFLAGFAWFCVGTMLLVLAYLWLSDAHGALGFMYFGFGFAAALLIHHFGFQKIADKNINRILPMPDRQCVFSFFTWKSYIIIIVMVTMGRLFRRSAIPKSYLAILYIAIGLALILSSLKYIRVFINEIKGTAAQSASLSGEGNSKEQQ
ncbi:MAG: hypothetical protein J7M40_04370 [Planctomycetes bacterium]|nr:hypothetical protein [Planctomycetota bacterium]